MGYRSVEDKTPIEMVKTLIDPLTQMGVITRELADRLQRDFPNETFRPQCRTYSDGKGICSDYTAYEGRISRRVRVPRGLLRRVFLGAERTTWLDSLYIIHRDSENTESGLSIDIYNASLIGSIKKHVQEVSGIAGLPRPMIFNLAQKNHREEVPLYS